MPRPYNKKTVTDAIAMLDVYASNACSVKAAAEAVGVRPSSTAYRVVDTMIDKLADMFPDDRLAYVASEAAGLLREGWRLGDPIDAHPNTQVTATLKNVDAILREQYPADVVAGKAFEPSPAFASTMYGVTRTSAPSSWAIGQCASDEPKDTTVQSAPEVFAEFDPRPLQRRRLAMLSKKQHAAAVVIDAETGAIVKNRYGEIVANELDATLAGPLDAVEEPTDEEIAKYNGHDEPVEDFGFDPYAGSAADLDTTEPSE